MLILDKALQSLQRVKMGTIAWHDSVDDIEVALVALGDVKAYLYQG